MTLRHLVVRLPQPKLPEVSVNRRTWMLLVIALCGASSLAAQAPTMPKLRHAFTTTDVDLAPTNRLTSIAVGPRGHVLFVSNAEATELRMALVDSTGRLVLRLGRTGAGPGEVRSPRPVEVGTDRLSAWDLENSVFLEWDFKGALQQSVKPIGLSGVSFVGQEVVGLRNVARVWQPVAVNRTTGQLRELIPPADTFMNAHFGLVDGKSASRYAPMPGVWGQGFVVADPGNYAVALYRWDGTLVRVLHRDVPPMRASAGRIDDFFATVNRQSVARGQPPMDEARMAMMRKQVADEVLPPITPGGAIRVDARNRIWLLGMEGDSAFADVFSPDRFLGRLPLPCRLFNGFWSLSGAWLAVACLPDNREFDGDAVIKLFRITEGGR